VTNGWDLTSQTGWARVRYDQYKWIPCLAVMPEGYDTARWARWFAETWWSISTLEYDKDDVARLESQLADIWNSTYGHILCHMAFIHLPDPRLSPLPVYLAILAASGDRDGQLRMLTRVDDPGQVRSPVVETFSTDQLGEGLRVMRHFREQEDSSRRRRPVFAGLSSIPST
jgi:hypothetical protein